MTNSRKSTHSVMNNSGFGSLTIAREEILFSVPVNAMNVDGTIKKRIARLLSMPLTVENAKALYKRGISVIKQ